MSNDNYTKAPNERLETIMKMTKTTEIKIALAAVRKIDGFHKTSDQISYSQFRKMTDLCQKSVWLGIQANLDNGFLKREKKGPNFVYTFNDKPLVAKVNQWQSTTSGENIPQVVAKVNSEVVAKVNTQKKEEKERKERAVDVLAHLNAQTGRNFQALDVNVKLIVSRLRDGLTPETLKAIVDLKCSEWLGDPKMSMYLRPSTLFGAEKCAQYAGMIGAVKSTKNTKATGVFSNEEAA